MPSSPERDCGQNIQEVEPSTRRDRVCLLVSLPTVMFFVPLAVYLRAIFCRSMVISTLSIRSGGLALLTHPGLKPLIRNYAFVFVFFFFDIRSTSFILSPLFSSCLCVWSLSMSRLCRDLYSRYGAREGTPNRGILLHSGIFTFLRRSKHRHRFRLN